MNYTYGTKVIYAWKPDASEPEKCTYVGSTEKGTHILRLKTGKLIEVKDNQIYKVD